MLLLLLLLLLLILFFPFSFQVALTGLSRNDSERYTLAEAAVGSDGMSEQTQATGGDKSERHPLRESEARYLAYLRRIKTAIVSSSRC